MRMRMLALELDRSRARVRVRARAPRLQPTLYWSPEKISFPKLNHVFLHNYMHSGCQIQITCRCCTCLATVQTLRRHDVRIRRKRILKSPKFDPRFPTLPPPVTFSVRRASLCFWNSVHMGINSTGFEFELVLTAGCADTEGTVSPDARFWRPHARHARSAPPQCPSSVRIASAHPTRYRGRRADLWKVVSCCGAKDDHATINNSVIDCCVIV